ncbi:hypothetical protein CMO93_00670 [Candidatus Woesearchaeota archaeon]|nr:hypothetical protein [Candidatus Woesearchaeota archaeon]|tara:strand:+ start:13937 stop:14785 length:849 start_codon:yes stop_codon:yes gene_type:complete
MVGANNPVSIAFKRSSIVKGQSIPYVVVLAAGSDAQQHIFYGHQAMVTTTYPGNCSDKFDVSLREGLYSAPATITGQVRMDDLEDTVESVVNNDPSRNRAGLILVARDKNGVPDIKKATVRSMRCNIDQGSEALAFAGVSRKEYAEFQSELNAEGNIYGLETPLGVALWTGNRYLGKFAGKEREPQVGIIYGVGSSEKTGTLISYPNSVTLPGHIVLPIGGADHLFATTPGTDGNRALYWNSHLDEEVAEELDESLILLDSRRAANAERKLYELLFQDLLRS